MLPDFITVKRRCKPEPRYQALPVVNIRNHKKINLTIDILNSQYSLVTCYRQTLDIGDLDDR